MAAAHRASARSPESYVWPLIFAVTTTCAGPGARLRLGLSQCQQEGCHEARNWEEQAELGTRLNHGLDAHQGRRLHASGQSSRGQRVGCAQSASLGRASWLSTQQWRR